MYLKEPWIYPGQEPITTDRFVDRKVQAAHTIHEVHPVAMNIHVEDGDLHGSKPSFAVGVAR